MQARNSQYSRFFLCKNPARLVFTLFITGLLLGVFIARNSIASLSQIVLTTSHFSATVSGLIASLCLPLLLSVIAVYYSFPAAIVPICLIKAFAFGYCSCVVLLSFQCAGWLVRLLFLFSDSLIVVPLLWFWLRHIDGTKVHLKQDTVLCLLAALIIGFLDYVCISPFLALLLQG